MPQRPLRAGRARRAVFALVATFAATVVFAAFSSPAARADDKPSKGKAPSPTRGLRYATLAPDGKTVAFTWRGDIWTVSTDNPQLAHRLTIHEAQDTIPRISPDGKQIAFSSQRSGGYDIYVMPIEGGEPQRVTQHSSAAILCDWSPDGKYLLFASNRDPGRYQLNLYEVAASGGTPRAITVDGGRDGSYSPDGKTIVYARGFNTIYQDNYEGTGNYDLYTVAREGGIPTALTSTLGNERNPFFSQDGSTIWFVAEEKGVANFYAMPAAGGERRQVSTWTGLDVQRPDLAWDGKTAVFERGARIHIADLTQDKPEAKLLPFVVRGDVRHSGITERTITSGAQHVHTSGDASRLVFSAFGDIWTMPVGGGKAQRLTDGAPKDEWPRLSPDGQWIAFQSDRSGNSDIWVMDVRGNNLKRLTDHPKDDFFHTWSPDGRYLAFSSERSGNRDIWRLDVRSGELKQLTNHKEADDDPCWSPDGQKIAFDSGREGTQAVYVMDADGGNVRRISRGSAFFQVPTWSPDGNMIAFEAFNPAAGASGASVAAACTAAFSGAASPFRIADSCSMSCVVSAAPSPPSLTFSTMPSSVSRHANSTSVTRVVMGAPPSRSEERTSSMRWVRPAILSKPMVALMPFSECATRKIVFRASAGSSGARSRSRIEAFRDWRFSRLSSRNRPRYSCISNVGPPISGAVWHANYRFEGGLLSVRMVHVSGWTPTLLETVIGPARSGFSHGIDSYDLPERSGCRRDALECPGGGVRG